MHFVRVMRSPDHVLVWHHWELVGDAASVRVPAGGARALVLYKGSFRARIDPEVRMGAEGQALFESRPGFDVNGYADCVSPTVFPITEGGWLAEGLEPMTSAFCIIPLTRVALEATFGGSDMADKLLPGGEWDGPYSQLPGFILPGQMDPRGIARIDRRGVHLVDVQLLRDAALNDLVVKLRELRAAPTVIERG